MIQSFANEITKNIWEGNAVTTLPPAIQQRAREKLRILNAARTIYDLYQPPSNRFHALKGGRNGQFSIRINDQWRICFRFDDGNAHEVEITDYH